MGDTVIAEDRGECSFIWDNFYYEEEQINEYDLTLFIHKMEVKIYTGDIRRHITREVIHWKR